MSSSLNIFQIDHHHHHYHDDQWCVLGGRRDDGVLNLGAKFAGNVAAQKPCIQQVMMMVNGDHYNGHGDDYSDGDCDGD